jgi:hypothetical protein
MYRRLLRVSTFHTDDSIFLSDTGSSSCIRGPEEGLCLTLKEASNHVDLSSSAATILPAFSPSALETWSNLTDVSLCPGENIPQPINVTAKSTLSTDNAMLISNNGVLQISCCALLVEDVTGPLPTSSHAVLVHSTGSLIFVSSSSFKPAPPPPLGTVLACYGMLAVESAQLVLQDVSFSNLVMARSAVSVLADA